MSDKHRVLWGEFLIFLHAFLIDVTLMTEISSRCSTTTEEEEVRSENISYYIKM